MTYLPPFYNKSNLCLKRCKVVLNGELIGKARSGFQQQQQQPRPLPLSLSWEIGGIGIYGYLSFNYHFTPTLVPHLGVRASECTHAYP